MKRYWKLAAAVAVGLNVATAHAELKVLLIGNRFIGSGASSQMLKYVYDNSDQGQTMKVNLQWICPGSLTDHWYSGTARQALLEDAWDFVVLQDRAGWSSPTAQDDAWLVDNIRQWDAEIKLKAPTARTVILAPPPLPNYLVQDQAHYQALYEGLAAELGSLLAPVGEAYLAGLTERPSFQLLYDTGAPTLAGNYLNAAFLYGTLTGDTPIGLIAPLTIPAGDREWLQQVAADALGIPEPATIGLLVLAVGACLRRYPTTRRC